MFVTQLIGSQTGRAFDMNYEEAKACIENGTARRATEDEITAAMEQSTAPVASIRPEELIAGYRMEPNDSGMYDVFDPGGVKISKQDENPLRNHLEAQEFMRAYARRTRGLPEEAGAGSNAPSSDDGEVDYGKMTVEDLQAEAKNRNLDTSSASKKADWVALLKRDDKVKAAIAAGEFETLTVVELQAYAAEHDIDLTGKTAKADIVDAVKAGKTSA